MNEIDMLIIFLKLNTVIHQSIHTIIYFIAIKKEYTYRKLHI